MNSFFQIFCAASKRWRAAVGLSLSEHSWKKKTTRGNPWNPKMLFYLKKNSRHVTKNLFVCLFVCFMQKEEHISNFFGKQQWQDSSSFQEGNWRASHIQLIMMRSCWGFIGLVPQTSETWLWKSMKDKNISCKAFDPAFTRSV